MNDTVQSSYSYYYYRSKIQYNHLGLLTSTPLELDHLAVHHHRMCLRVCV